MNILHKPKHTAKLLKFRALSLVTHNVKPGPTELKLVAVDGSLTNNSRLVQFYSDTYLREDPVVVAAGLKDLTELRKFLSVSLKTQHSVFLTRRNGEIVAAASAGPVTSSTPNHIRLYADEEIKDPASQRLLHLWADVTAQGELLRRLRTPSLWDISFVAVTPGMRRLALSRFLLDQQRRLAGHRGHHFLTLESSSIYMSKVCENAGFMRLAGRRPDSYLDPAGIPWVPTPLTLPHTDIQIFYHVIKHCRKVDADI